MRGRAGESGFRACDKWREGRCAGGIVGGRSRACDKWREACAGKIGWVGGQFIRAVDCGARQVTKGPGASHNQRPAEESTRRDVSERSDSEARAAQVTFEHIRDGHKSEKV